MKLLRTEREVAYYSIKDESIEGEFNIDTISLNQLLTIVIPNHDDPELIDGYPLTETQLEKINELTNNKIIPNYKLYYYVLECTGIYDYT